MAQRKREAVEQEMAGVYKSADYFDPRRYGELMLARGHGNNGKVRLVDVIPEQYIHTY